MNLTTVPEEALEAPVRGYNLKSGLLKDQLGERETLLVFLRHLG